MDLRVARWFLGVRERGLFSRNLTQGSFYPLDWPRRRDQLAMGQAALCTWPRISS